MTAGVSLTLWSVVGDDGDRLPGVLQGGGGLFVRGVAEVHPVHLETTTRSSEQTGTSLNVLTQLVSASQT